MWSRSTYTNVCSVLMSVIFLLLSMKVLPQSKTDDCYLWVSRDGVTYRICQTDNGLRICFRDGCVNIGYNFFVTNYRGLFRQPLRCTTDYALAVDYNFRVPRSDKMNNCCPGTSDGDRCCETKQCNYFPTIETDITGTKYFVIHFGNSYQTVPIGLCGKANGCSGRCVIMDAVHSLLVFDPSNGGPWSQWFSFKPFSFSSHCACHNA